MGARPSCRALRGRRRRCRSAAVRGYGEPHADVHRPAARCTRSRCSSSRRSCVFVLRRARRPTRWPACAQTPRRADAGRSGSASASASTSPLVVAVRNWVERLRPRATGARASSAAASVSTEIARRAVEHAPADRLGRSSSRVIVAHRDRRLLGGAAVLGARLHVHRRCRSSASRCRRSGSGSSRSSSSRRARRTGSACDDPLLLLGRPPQRRDGLRLDYVRHLVLPVLTLTVQLVAAWSRYQRASMLDVMSAPTTSARPGPRACPRRKVVFKHALRNALIPLVTVMALDIGALFGGLIITETIFSIAGHGPAVLRRARSGRRRRRCCRG